MHQLVIVYNFDEIESTFPVSFLNCVTCGTISVSLRRSLIGKTRILIKIMSSKFTSSAQKVLATQRFIGILSDVIMTAETFMNTSKGKKKFFLVLLPKHLPMC